MGGRKKRIPMDCVLCKLEVAKKVCMVKEGTGSTGCPTLTQRKVLDRSNREYERPNIKEFA
jgi:hypothetical protein